MRENKTREMGSSVKRSHLTPASTWTCTTINRPEGCWENNESWAKSLLSSSRENCSERLKMEAVLDVSPKTNYTVHLKQLDQCEDSYLHQSKTMRTLFKTGNTLTVGCNTDLFTFHSLLYPVFGLIVNLLVYRELLSTSERICLRKVSDVLMSPTVFITDFITDFILKVRLQWSVYGIFTFKWIHIQN